MQMKRLKRRTEAQAEKEEKRQRFVERKERRKAGKTKTPPKDVPYNHGAEGCIKWAEENVRIPVYHGISTIPSWTLLGDLPPKYQPLWEMHKNEIRNALVLDENNRFQNRLIVFCWPRGEGKSVLVCIIVLWKFFNFPMQNITLGATTKDQSEFVHYKWISDIILNSPNLLRRVGKRNVLDYEVRMKDRNGNTVSTITAISTSTGIYSNIDGYTFSEMFAMKDTKFFVELDGSIRAVPNAFGIIDSTVSDKSHQLYRLYQSWVKGDDPTLYFSYRYSNDGNPEDYCNPETTAEQLASYKSRWVLGDFERFFLNLWSAGAAKVFTSELIDSIYYIGVDGKYGNHEKVKQLLSEKIRLEEQGDLSKIGELRQKINEVSNRLVPVDKMYSLDNPASPGMATIDDLRKLEETFDTYFTVHAGIDRADPMKKDASEGARTIFTVVAKGLVGSRSNPHVFYDSNTTLRYVHFLLQLKVLKRSSLEEMKDAANAADLEYDGLDSVCSERWGIWDFESWCDENEVHLEVIHPSYDKQKAVFSEFFTLVRDGFFKSPKIHVPGSRWENILSEEMSVFDHNRAKRWFGSPEKFEKGGIQDDVMYSLGYAIYGGRGFNVDHLRPRGAGQFMGMVINPSGLVGQY